MEKCLVPMADAQGDFRGVPVVSGSRVDPADHPVQHLLAARVSSSELFNISRDGSNLDSSHFLHYICIL